MRLLRSVARRKGPRVGLGWSNWIELRSDAVWRSGVRYEDLIAYNMKIVSKLHKPLVNFDSVGGMDAVTGRHLEAAPSIPDSGWARAPRCRVREGAR